jgi:hypothetical protein
MHQTLEHVVLNERSLHAAVHSTVYRSRRLRVSMSQILSIPENDKIIVCSKEPLHKPSARTALE